MPTVDDILGPAPARQKTVDDILGPASAPQNNALYATGDMAAVHDHHFSQGPVGHILDAFGQGAKHGWGAEPFPLSPETEDFLKKSGVFNDYQNDRTSLIRSANEAFIRPAAAGLSGLFRGGSALFVGAQAGVERAFTEAGAPRLGRDIAAMPEAFMGSPGALARPHPHPTAPLEGIDAATLNEARALGVIGEGEAGWRGTRAPSPIDVDARAQAVREELAATKEAEAPRGELQSPEGAVATEPPPYARKFALDVEPVPAAEPANANVPGTEVMFTPEPVRAADALPRPDRPLVDKAGNIRLENLGTPEDVNQVIRETASLNNEFMNERRGVISDAQASDLADALGMDAARLDRRKIGEAFNAEEVIAARKLLIKSATGLRDAAAKVASGSEQDLMAYAAAREQHAMIQGQVSGVTAEAGRALRAFRSLEGSAEARQIGDILRDNLGKGINDLRSEAALMGKLETTQQVSRFIDNMQKPTLKDKFLEAWINALLSNPVTHAANIAGNAAVAVSSVAETGITAAIGRVREIIAGEPVERLHFMDMKADLFGLVQGSRRGLIVAGKALADENAISRAPHTLEGKPRQAIPSVKINVGGVEMGLGGTQVRLPSRFLMAEDELFRAIGKEQSMNRDAYRQAADEGLDGNAFNRRVSALINNPTDEMLAEAEKRAQYQTFTNPLGKHGQALQAFSNDYLLAKMVIPFIRTPIDIFKYAVERTPFGLAMGEVRDNIAAGGTARDTQLARMALGSMLATGVASFAADGFGGLATITGSGPTNPEERAAMRLTGWQPNSIRVGNMYFSYGRLDPFATIMGVTADVADAWRRGSEDGAQLDKISAMLAGSLWKNIAGKLSLRGASDLIQTLTDPDRYAEHFLQNLAGSFVPSVVAQIERIEDPILREARSIMDTVRSRLPGFSEDLFPKHDVFGQSIRLQGAFGPDIVSPIFQSKITNDPAAIAMLRLGIFPSQLDRKIKGVELTDKQYDDLSRVAGTLVRAKVASLVAIPGFTNWPAFAQRELITEAINSARETARDMVTIQNPAILGSALRAKKEDITGERKPREPIRQP